MIIALASDHRGFEQKSQIAHLLRSQGFELRDFGCPSANPCDYPDFGVPAAQAVAIGQADFAILLDSSGIGMSVCANKVLGVRAAVVHDEVMARVARDAIDCNVLCIGTDLIAKDNLNRIVDVFLTTQFGGGRHSRRIEKIGEIERECAQSDPVGIVAA